ncbi:MAG: hypothetical protein K2O21_00455, partial [Malacoplasma sp.]|nr:hypothetical protein [Malacoplasma sp.]
VFITLRIFYKKNKKRWIIFSTVTTVLGLSTAVPLSLFYSINNSMINFKKIDQNQQYEKKELVPAQNISQNFNLSTKTGPLTF